MEGAVADQAVLTRVEWQAVTVALRDAERGHGAKSRPGAAGRLWRWLTGAEPPRPLADPRLEAVRRFVWAARRQGGRACELVPELLGFGFTPAQVEAIARVAT
jgi:hypothetical protein